MSKLTAAMLVIALLFPIFLIINPTDAETSVSGSITSNTTWTKANSPYKMTGVVTVQEGVTLTIEPGVTFELGGWYMYVRGSLHAEGKPYDQIHFTADTPGYDPAIYLETTSSDCSIKNVILDQVGLVIRGDSPNIEDNSFLRSKKAAIDAEKGVPTITGNIFEDIPTKGVSVCESARVTNNLFNKTTGQATAIIATGQAYVAGNQIISFYQGIAAGGLITVENNIVINCSYGAISSVDSAVTTKGNYISGSTYGIKGGGTIDSNTIVNNEYGIIIDTVATINNNNIVNNPNGLALTTKGTFDATNNYWGSIDPTEVAQLITDNQDRSELGTVNYKPILTSPSSTAPNDETVEKIAASAGSWSTQGFLVLIEDNVYLIFEVVIVSIIMAWIIVVAFVFVKRRNQHKRYRR